MIHACIRVQETGEVGAARRAAARLGERAGLDETGRGRVAIIVTELANNLVAHAGGGRILLQAWAAPGRCGLEILSIDEGPGMADPGKCLTDGYSTAGTKGEGLGSVRRLSSQFDLWSDPRGTVIVSRVTTGSAGVDPLHPAVGAVCVAMAGETANGDDWAVAGDGARIALMVADGLGHGPDAALASGRAVDAFHANMGDAPSRVLQRIDEALRQTRGGAVAVAMLTPASRSLAYAGVGNIAASIVMVERSRGLMSHGGIVGTQPPRITEIPLEWTDPALLVVHSDGLQSRWTLEGYAGLSERHPALIAAILYRDFARGRDDLTVVVIALSQVGVE